MFGRGLRSPGGSTPAWVGYPLAVLATAGAFFVTASYPELFFRTPYALFFILGGLLALRFGVGPGLVVAVLTVLVTSFLMEPPVGPLRNVGFIALAVPTLIFIERHRRALSTIHDSERRYQHLTELSSDIVLLDDLEGRIQWLNITGSILSGYALEELVGRKLLDFIAPEHVERALEARRALLAPGGPKTVSLEIDLLVAQGRRITVDARSGLAVAHGRVVGFHSVARDVTEQRHLEAKLRQSQKMEAVGRLAGGIAHDFNNLLTAIVGYAESALAGIGPAHPQAEDLRGLCTVCERAADLTRQLLAFGRQQALEPVVLDVNEAVRSVESMLRRLIGSDIVLTSRLDPNAGHVQADPNQLMLVLMNLTVNARDAMPGGGRLTIETSSVESPNGYVRSGAMVGPGRFSVIAVTDTGVGMDAATQARIFEPFFTTKPEGAGTGLGLATVYGIVKQSGGYIWVDSAVGRGTRFEVQLPCADEPASQALPGRESPDRVSGRETILLAEDDAQVRELVADALTERGYTVFSLPDGAAAAALVDRGEDRIDLLVTDVVMPGMSGPELAAHTRRAHPGVKVLFMSGFAPAEGRQHRYTIDAPLIQKPFAPSSLVREVRAVLDGTPARTAES